MTIEPIEANISQIEALAENYALGQEAIAELELLKPVLALAISKLPKKQLKLTLKEQTTIGEFALQMKQEEKSGAIVFRSVKA